MTKLMNRLTPPEFKAVRDIAFPNIRIEKLDNGCPLYILNGGTQEVIKLDVMVNAGSIYSTQKLVAPLTGLMLNEGTSGKNAHQIAEAFDFYGAYFQPTTEKDKTFVGLVTLSKYLEQTLPLFSEVLNQSIFPQKEFDILVDRRRQNFLVEQEKTSFLAREVFYEKLFGPNHPYGMKTQEAHYLTTPREDVFEFYQEHFHAGNFEFIVSGKVGKAEIQLINQYLGRLPKKGTSESLTPTIQTAKGTPPFVVEKESAIQSSIRTGLVTVNKLHPDYMGLKILVTIFGGYFGSRLMKNIREEKGYTYGINAMQVSLMQTGFMAVAADVKAENTREALHEIIVEMEKLKKEPIPMEELHLVRNYMMGDMLQMFDGPFSTADTFKAVVPYNLGFDYFRNMQETLWSISAERLLEFANRYFVTENLTTVVAGKY
jgi:predicted Zn-dependent peptidase